MNKSLVDFSIVLFCRNLYSKQLSCQLVNNIFVKRLGFSLLRMLSKWKEKIVWPFFCCWSPNPHTFSKFFLPVHGRNTSGQLNPFVVAILLVLSPTPRAARNYIPRVPKILYIPKKINESTKLFCDQSSKHQNSIQCLVNTCCTS